MRITRHVKWLWPVAYNASISEISNGKYFQLCNTFSTLETFLAPTGSSNRVTKITPNTLHAYTVQFLVNNSYGLLGRTERDFMVESYCSVQQSFTRSRTQSLCSLRPAVKKRATL